MDRNERTTAGGFSLAGLLVLVVVLGLLSAAAVVGVSSLTSSDDSIAVIRGKSTGSVGAGGGTSASRAPGTTGAGPGAAAACAASVSAATTASTVYFTTNGAYPSRWSDLTAAQPPLFVLTSDVAVNPANPAELDGRGWKLVMAGGGATAPTLTCG